MASLYWPIQMFRNAEGRDERGYLAIERPIFIDIFPIFSRLHKARIHDAQ